MAEKNIHSGHRRRMKNRCLIDGAGSLQTHELLEVLLYYCIPMKDTNVMAHKMLNEYGSLTMIANADTQDIERRCGVTENTAIFFSLISEYIKRCNIEKWAIKISIDSTDAAGMFAVSLLEYEKYECFYVICLDNQKRLINSVLINRGTIDEAPVYPRIVVECALRHQASSVLFAHNHPGGSEKPSAWDLELTIKLAKILNSIDIFVLDHIIVADDKYYSFADNGFLKNGI